MPSGKKRKRHKIATHKRKKRLRKNRHKKKYVGSSTITRHFVQRINHTKRFVWG